MTEITTSRSAVACYLTCPRKRYFTYEAENGTATPGWERRKLAIPLVTGIFVHKGLELLLKGSSPDEAAEGAKGAYLEEVGSRGLAVEEGTDEQNVVEEQAAHVEALVLAWARVRLPKWLDEYELVEAETEDRVPLAEDVVLAVRADAVVRRKYDHRMFVVNFKTVGTADERWIRQWETDMQLMTELLAAERRHGGTFGGVIIEGLVKGRRMPEKNDVGDVVGYRDQTPLLYGYKCDADPPLRALEYSHEYTRRKGWYRFPVWNEPFQGSVAGFGNVSYEASHLSPLQYWINWLPEEVVEGQFQVVPPIMRDPERIESCVRQIVAIERRIARAMSYSGDLNDPDTRAFLLDNEFPQNTAECHWPSRCQCYDMCWTNGVAEDPAGSGLYQARTDHHKLQGGGE